ncbi:MAG: AraC family transcriptional regulator, partial [Anaerovorax sp.]
IHFIHSDDVHGLTGITEDNLIIVLSININYFSKFFTNLSTQIFSTRVNEDAHLYVKQQMELKYYIFSIISLLNKRDLDYIDQVCALSKSLIGALYKDFRGFAINKTNRNFEPKFSHDFIQTERISRVVSFIYENYAYKLSLSEIAENEHINKYYLSHLFQKFVCENFRDFVSMVRVEMSESKLLETDKSVSFIAGECGFSNAKYYIDHFITWFGVHPNAYREKCRPNTIDFKSSSFTVHELKEIEPLLKDYLDSIVEFSDSFSISPSTKASIDFSSHSTAEFHLFEHFTLHIYDPDLHPCLNFEENALHLMNTLHHVGGHTKISILEPLATKMLSSETDPASIYLDTFVHSKCIEIMKEFVLNPN